MRYIFQCKAHPHEMKDMPYYFEVFASIKDGPPSLVVCPCCSSSAHVQRIYHVPSVIYNAEGFSGDYYKSNPGKGRSWDKKEDLNRTWSAYYNEPPPPADSKGTYDGT